MLELACSPVSSGDATQMDEIHRLTRVTTREPPLPRQGTQWQRQADAGLWAEIDNDAPTKWGYSCRWLYVTVTDTLNRYLRFGMN